MRWSWSQPCTIKRTKVICKDKNNHTFEKRKKKKKSILKKKFKSWKRWDVWILKDITMGSGFLRCWKDWTWKDLGSHLKWIHSWQTRSFCWTVEAGHQLGLSCLFFDLFLFLFSKKRKRKKKLPCNFFNRSLIIKFWKILFYFRWYYFKQMLFRYIWVILVHNEITL